VTPAAETYIEVLRQAEDTEAALRRAQATGSSMVSAYAALLENLRQRLLVTSTGGRVVAATPHVPPV